MSWLDVAIQLVFRKGGIPTLVEDTERLPVGSVIFDALDGTQAARVFYGSLSVLSKQIADDGNSAVITSASPTGNAPLNPFVGVPFATTERGIQETISIATAFDAGGNPIPDLGFTLTFRGLPEGIVRPAFIPKLFSKRLLHTTDWLSNQWTNYQVEIEPSRPLVAGETLVVSTRHSLQTGNKFLYPLDYAFLESIQTAGLMRTISASVQPDGSVVNERAGGRVPENYTEAILIANDNFTPVWVNMDQAIAVSALIRANVASASGGVQFQFRAADPADPELVPDIADPPHYIAPRTYNGGSVGVSFRVDKPAAKWGRVAYFNSTTGQASMLMSVNLETSSLSTDVQIAAPDNMITKPVTIGTSPVQLDSTQLIGRLSSEFYSDATNTNNQRIFIGHDNTVTTSGSTRGRPVENGTPYRFDLSLNKQVWAVASTANMTGQFTQIGK